MERREFLKVAIGVAAGAVVFAAGAQAALLSPQPLVEQGRSPGNNEEIRPAIVSGDEVDRLAPEQVRWGHGHHWGWGHGHHWGWRHRHWGWRRRHWGWHHRHWGWRHRRWHHRYYW